MSTKKKKYIQLQCPHCKQQFTHIQYDARNPTPTYCGPACLLTAMREQKRAAMTYARPAPPREPMPLLRTVPTKEELRAQSQDHGFPRKVKQVCWVWWDRKARAYRGTVREVPIDGQAQWDSYRIWTEATAIIDVEAASIPELADLMRRYATMDENTRRALLLDTPPRLRGQAGPAHTEREDVR